MSSGSLQTGPGPRAAGLHPDPLYLSSCPRKLDSLEGELRGPKPPALPQAQGSDPLNSLGSEIQASNHVKVSQLGGEHQEHESLSPLGLSGMHNL